MSNWKFHASLKGGYPVLRSGKDAMEMLPSVTIAAGDPLIFDATGKVKKCTAKTDLPLYVAAETKTSTATGGEKIEVYEIGRGDLIWKVLFTPLYKNQVASAGGSTTSIILPSAPETYSANDWRGGKIFCVETRQLLTITASDNPSAGNPLTLTVTQPLTSTSVGKTFHATFLGFDDTAVQLKGTVFDEPSQTIAEITGGKLRMMDVNLPYNEIYVMVP